MTPALPKSPLVPYTTLFRSIGFTVKVTNPGPGKAYDVTVSDPLPSDAGTSFSIDAQDGTACSINRKSTRLNTGHSATSYTLSGLQIHTPTKTTCAEVPLRKR